MRPPSHKPAVFSWRSSWPHRTALASGGSHTTIPSLSWNTRPESLWGGCCHLRRVPAAVCAGACKNHRWWPARCEERENGVWGRPSLDCLCTNAWIQISAFVQCKWGTITQLPLRSLFFCIFYILPKELSWIQQHERGWVKSATPPNTGDFKARCKETRQNLRPGHNDYYVRSGKKV